jgi:hypothetical protein
MSVSEEREEQMAHEYNTDCCHHGIPRVHCEVAGKCALTLLADCEDDREREHGGTGEYRGVADLTDEERQSAGW